MTRARRSFWVLVAVAVLAAGGLSQSINARPGPLAGIGLATSAFVLVVSLTLAARVMVAIERARRRS